MLVVALLGAAVLLPRLRERPAEDPTRPTSDRPGRWGVETDEPVIDRESVPPEPADTGGGDDRPARRAEEGLFKARALFNAIRKGDVKAEAKAKRHIDRATKTLQGNGALSPSEARVMQDLQQARSDLARIGGF